MPATAQSTIVVVDDDEGTCRALARSLSCNGYRVRTYTRARDYLADRDQVDPACVVADINMPDLDGLSMYQEERSEGYEVPTVFVTGCVDVRTAVRAMKDGALDLLEKPVDESVLLATIQAAMERSRVLRAERDDIASVWRRLDLLTPREAEICALVASGRLNKQIAALIGTTEKTVKVHRARVMAKLNVSSVAGLVRLVDHVLGSPPPGPIFDADRHARRRPRALAFMASALAAASTLHVEAGSPSRLSARRVYREAADAAEKFF
jgi:FixJ family two-component response regulator